MLRTTRSVGEQRVPVDGSRSGIALAPDSARSALRLHVPLASLTAQARISEHVELKDPTTGRKSVGPKWMSDREVKQILSASAQAQVEWTRVPLQERSRLLHRAAELLLERKDEYAKIMAREVGKPLADGRAEVEKCALVCRYYADHAEEFLAPRTIESDAKKSYVRYDPTGVVLAIMPWNFPFWQVFRFAAPNLMAGNGGVLKHADNVPRSALAIEKLFADAGFPKDLFRTLIISVPQVQAVIENGAIQGVTLTGSEQAGRSVGRIAGGALKKMVLELGGSDPFLVLPGADVKRAAEVAAKSRCINAGQSCIAAKRFIVEESVYDEFVDHFTRAMKEIALVHPMDGRPGIGPQVNVKARRHLQDQVDEAVRQGARVTLGGKIPPGPGAYYPPTILVDVAPENIAAREELFGPVAAIVKVPSTERAIAIANQTKFGLGASIWTDVAKAESLVPQIEAGAVFVNGMVKSDPRLPFGGIKASGIGRELAREGMLEFVNTKTVWIG
jgi:succinate-semialdehyde dehydrogenase / glutarate-semialdehyde dehydrogenase